MNILAKTTLCCLLLNTTDVLKAADHNKPLAHEQQKITAPVFYQLFKELGKEEQGPEIQRTFIQYLELGIQCLRDIESIETIEEAEVLENPAIAALNELFQTVIVHELEELCTKYDINLNKSMNPEQAEKIQNFLISSIEQHIAVLKTL